MAAEVVLSEVEDQGFAKLLLDGLVDYNARFAGADDYRPLNLAVRRDGEAEPAGGLSGGSFHRWMFIKFFFLPEDLRRQGLGAGLLARAEAEARRRGCVGIHLDTFSFQARPFYERQGYSLFGTLADFPPGHSRYFLMKRLDAAAPAGLGEGAHVPA